MGNYYHTKESVEEYIRSARGHDGRQVIAKLREYLPEDSLLLEIGSGPGTDWKLLQQHYRVVGSDQSKEFLKHLRTSIPEGEFLALDAASLDTGRLFQGIYSNKVLHHLEDQALATSIKRQCEILHPGGIVCHTFWYGQDTETYNDLFINYHNEEGICKLFGKYFDPLRIKFYKEFDPGDSFLYIGKKKGGISS